MTFPLQESVRWAPDVIRSQLIQYLIDVENSKTGLRHHTGALYYESLALATKVWPSRSPRLYTALFNLISRTASGFLAFLYFKLLGQ